MFLSLVSAQESDTHAGVRNRKNGVKKKGGKTPGQRGGGGRR